MESREWTITTEKRSETLRGEWGFWDLEVGDTLHTEAGQEMRIQMVIDQQTAMLYRPATLSEAKVVAWKVATPSNWRGPAVTPGRSTETTKGSRNDARNEE